MVVGYIECLIRKGRWIILPTKKISDKVNVLVTAVGNIGVGSQIVKSLHLADVPLNIIGVDISDFNINEKLDFFYRVSRADTTEYKMQIDKIICSHDIQIIFVGSEQEYQFFRENRMEYVERGVYLAINSDEISKNAFDKNRTYEVLNSKGIDTPKYCKINSFEDYKKIDFFPVVIKPNTCSASSRNVQIAFDEEDAKGFVRYMLNLDIDVVAQEYVGDCNSEYTIQVTSNKKQEVVGSIIIRRNFSSSISYKNRISKAGKEYVISSGITQGEIIKDNYIKKQAEDIARALNSSGSLNIQAMYSNKKLLVIEVHPMITGSVYVRALAGYNEPVNIIKGELLNQDVSYDYRECYIHRKLTNELIEKV